jgi:Spirocyclase AveC-like
MSALTEPSVVQVAAPPEDRAPDSGARVDRSGMASVWALLGVIWLAVIIEVWGRWIASDHFAAAPILGPDKMANGKLIALRAVEVVSVLVFVGLLWQTLIRPWRRDRRIGLDGMLFVACFLGTITEGVLNEFHYLFAFNAHSVNLGAWAAFMPLHLGGPHTRYGEALLWGLPMYVYFVLGVGMAGCALVRALRRRYPQISNAAALGAVFAGAFVFDLLVENAIIRATNAYAFTKVPSSVTLWAGTFHQFPLYESVSVGLLGGFFTALRLSAADDPDGVSFVERGFLRYRPELRRPLRWLALIGFTATILLCVYHIPYALFGSNGTSLAPMPSYMLPGH